MYLVMLGTRNSGGAHVDNAPAPCGDHSGHLVVFIQQMVGLVWSIQEDVTHMLWQGGLADWWARQASSPSLAESQGLCGLSIRAVRLINSGSSGLHEAGEEVPVLLNVRPTGVLESPPCTVGQGNHQSAQMQGEGRYLTIRWKLCQDSGAIFNPLQVVFVFFVCLPCSLIQVHGLCHRNHLLYLLLKELE